MSKLDSAISYLRGVVSKFDRIDGEEIKDEFNAAIRVLEASANVPKADAIKNLNGIFVFCAIHGQTQTIPSIVAAMELIESLPDDTDAKEKP